MSELRWNPLLGEWLATATERQERTFHPPPGYCPLCPTKPGAFETEVPEPDYDVVIFENKFPSLRPDPPNPAIDSRAFAKWCSIRRTIIRRLQRFRPGSI
jgi:UDPglucose--hexose-1-phosphate uridylyltransferase